MKFRKAMWRGVKPLVDVPRWMGLGQIKKNASLIGTMAKGVFTTEKATRVETFSEASRRLNLSETELQQRQKQFHTLFFVFLIVGILLIIYFIYNLIAGEFFATLFSFVVACIAFVEAFRNHFWYTQMKNRKLGMSFKNWLAMFLNKKV